MMCKVSSVHFNMTLNLCLECLLVAVCKLFSNKVLAEQECSEKKEKNINLLYVQLRF